MALSCGDSGVRTATVVVVGTSTELKTDLCLLLHTKRGLLTRFWSEQVSTGHWQPNHTRREEEEEEEEGGGGGGGGGSGSGYNKAKLNGALVRCLHILSSAQSMQCRAVPRRALSPRGAPELPRAPP